MTLYLHNHHPTTECSFTGLGVTSWWCSEVQCTVYSALANYADAAYEGYRLHGVFRRVAPCGGPCDQSYPVVRQSSCMRKGTPVLSDYFQQSADSGRRLGRIRHVYRPSRPVRDPLSERLHTLNCQGLAWHRLQHRDKLVQLLLHMRSSRADLMALTELHGTMGPCVVHIEDFVLVTNDRAGWLLTLEFYVLWSQSGKRRWDRGDNLCALRSDLCNKTYVFVAVYLLPFVRVADRRQTLAELDLLRADFPPECHEVLAGDWNAHAGLDHVGDHVHQGQFSLSTPTTMGSYSPLLALRNEFVHGGFLSSLCQTGHMASSEWQFL